MKDVNGLMHMQAADEVRAKLSALWEIGQKEMNVSRNEHFFLTREIQKLLSKKETLEKEIETASLKVSKLEATIGLKSYQNRH